jgi:hypothetical protein
MTAHSNANFPHRHNKDGSYDSICTTCHATVATVNRETELAQYEHSHACNPARLYQLTRSRTTWGPFMLAR